MISTIRYLLLAVVLTCVMVIGAAAFEQGRVWFGGVAIAQTAPLVIDAGTSDAGLPLAAPAVVTVPVALPVPDLTKDVEQLSQAEKLYKSGAFVDAGILLAFVLLSVASARVPWLRQDHRGVICSAVLGGLALLVVPASQGATPNLSMIVGAVTAAACLIVNPKMPAAIAANLPPARVVAGGDPPAAS